MVLDAGRIVSIKVVQLCVAIYGLQVEFDSPKALLKNKRGMLRALVDESGDKDVLYGMAED